MHFLRSHSALWDRLCTSLVDAKCIGDGFPAYCAKHNVTQVLRSKKNFSYFASSVTVFIWCSKCYHFRLYTMQRNSWRNVLMGAAVHHVTMCDLVATYVDNLVIGTTISILTRKYLLFLLALQFKEIWLRNQVRVNERGYFKILNLGSILSTEICVCIHVRKHARRHSVIHAESYVAK